MEPITFPDDQMYNGTEDFKVLDINIYRMTQIVSITFYSITFILGIIGNGLVIWIAGFKMKKTVTILWFLNLAIADFVFDMILPLEITHWIMDSHWPFGQIMCKVVPTVIILNMYVSTSFLMIISIDRCLTTMCPVWSQNHRSPKLALIISAITWLFCFTLSAPNLAFLDINHYSENTISICTDTIPDDDDTDIRRRNTLIMIRFVFMFVIPLPIIVICYSLIIFRMKRSRSLSRSNRPLKVIITVVLCFFFFWLPFHIWPLLEFLKIEMDVNVTYFMYNLGYCIGYFNSCVNPIIYVFVGRDFKKSFFRSISFLLESTFKEKDDFSTDPQINQANTSTATTTFQCNYILHGSPLL